MDFVCIGEFRSESGALAACDPCYANARKGRGVVENAARGTWRALTITEDAGKWGERVHFLVAIHESFPGDRGKMLVEIGENQLPEGFSVVSQDVWVELGMCGIFDADALGPTLPPAKGYAVHWNDTFPKVCSPLADYDREGQGGVLEYGAVSTSGYGDGSYWCCAHRNQEGVADVFFVRFL